MGNDHENCASVTKPCQTIQHAFDKVALSNDVIKIDGSFGNFTMKKQVRILKPTNITFTSYNGVPWIYGEISSWRFHKYDWFLVVEKVESSQISVITINKLNFRDILLARIGRRKDVTKMRVNFKVINSRCELFEKKTERRYMHFPTVIYTLILVNIQFTDITLEGCAIKANNYAGIIRHPSGYGCNHFISTVITFINTTVEDTGYSVNTWSPKCTNKTTMPSYTLSIINCFFKSNRKQPTTSAQFRIFFDKECKNSRKTFMHVKNSRFEDLWAKFGIAAAMDIRGNIFVKIINCTFKGNTGSKGGALSFQVNSLRVHDSYFEGNRARVHRTCYFDDDTGFGGAILARGCNGETRILIKDSTFLDNMADCYGSAIYFKSLKIVTVHWSRFCTMFTKGDSTNTLWFSSSSSVRFKNVSFEAKERSEGGVLFYARSYRIRPGKSTPYFKCPKGSEPSISIIHSIRYAEVTTKVSCQYCPKHSYTLRPSYAIGLNETKSKQAQQQQHCHQCSLGAVCKRGIKPKPNFWGYVNKGKAFMLVCPPGYCCQTKDKCVALQSCNGMRTGRLCGKCKNGYFQSFFTSECLHEKFCKTGKFWALAVCFSVLFTVLFIFLQDIFTIIVKSLSLKKMLSLNRRKVCTQIRIFLCMKKVEEQGDWSDDDSGTDNELIIDESNHTAVENTHESPDDQSNNRNTDSNNNSMAGGLIKIVFFFYQIHSVLMVYKSHREIQYLTEIKGLILSVFNLNIQAHYGGEVHCPLYKMDSTAKVLIKALFPINCLIFATFLYILVHALALCFKSNEMIQMYSMKAKPRLLTAILQLILLGYSILISSTLSLVTCLPLVTGQKILYIDGSVSCYQHWQYAILTFIIVWAIPLIYALHKLPIYMRNGEISIRGFYIALLLPLPFAVYAIIRGARKIKSANANDSETHSLTTPLISPETMQDTDDMTMKPPFISHATMQHTDDMTMKPPFISHATMQHTDDMTMKLLNVIEDPFRCKSSGKEQIKISWEPVLLLQRLLLSLCNTFMLEPTKRSLLLLLFVILFAKVNDLYRPFNSFILNVMNGLTFILLCITGIINAIYAFIYEYGSVPSGPFVQMLALFDYLEVIIVLIFPSIAALMFAVLALSKLIELTISLVCCVVRHCKRCMSSET